MSQRKFIVFINPIAGTKNKAAIRPLIEKALAENNFLFQVLPTERSGNYDFLPQKISTENITDIIICGGDGTVNQVCSYLRGTTANAGIIPLGSGNGLAFAAGIPKNPEKALSIIIKGKASAIDAFLINNKFSCMLCGLGFDAQVAHNFAKQSSRGLSTYVQQTLRSFFIARPYPFLIKTGNGEFGTDAFFISIANSNQFGNNFTIAPRASLSDGLLDIVIAGKASRLQFLVNVLRQVRQGRITPEGIMKKGMQYFHTKSITISNPDKAPLHIDGDPAETADHFEIAIIEKAFLLLQP
jgi:diacylglycerol kinase (ATP)